MDNFDTTLEQEPAEALSPGTWLDLVLYLTGGVGLFVLAGLAVSYYFPEINFTVTLLAIATNVIFLAGTVYLLGIRRKKLSWKSLGLSPPVWRVEYWLLAPGLALGFMPIRGLIGLAAEMLVSGDLENLQMRNDLLTAGGFTFGGFLAMLLGVGILAPISEELYFRGLLHGWLRQRLPVGWAVAVSSLAFGLAHMDSVGVMISAFVMGIVIAVFYERTNSLWVPVLIHIVTNSTAVVLLYLAMAAVKFFGFEGL